MPFKIPVPDPWRLNYPHYIGSPTALRCCYVIVSLLTVLVFVASCGYYYEYEKDTISEIDFFIKNESEWNCNSIGTYNGNYQFFDPSSLTSNLSITTSVAFLPFITLQDESGVDSLYKKRSTTVSTGTDSFVINTYTIPKGEDIDIFHIGLLEYEITWGNAPTIDECVDTMHQHACSIINESNIINDVSVYKFTFDFELLTNGTHPNEHNMIFEKPRFYSFSGFTSHVFFFNKFTETDEYYVVSDKISGDHTLCDLIDDGIAAGALYWQINVNEGGSSDSDTYLDYPGWIHGNPMYPWINGVRISYECQVINNDYCIVNATEQFTFTESKRLPTNTRMMRTENMFMDPDQQQFLLLGSELGAECNERWESVCIGYYDIEGYCDTVFSPPYSCSKTQNKSAYAILSLSFASCQLVFTVLIILVTMLFKACAKPVHDSALLQMHMNQKQMADKTPTSCETTELQH